MKKGVRNESIKFFRVGFTKLNKPCNNTCLCCEERGGGEMKLHKEDILKTLNNRV